MFTGFELAISLQTEFSMKTLLNLFFIILSASTAMSQNEMPAKDISSLQVVKAYRNQNGKYIIAGIRKVSDMQVSGRNVEFATYNLYYGDKENLHELSVENVAGAIGNAEFQVKFFAYKAIHNRTLLKANANEAVVEHDLLGQEYSDKYQRLSGEELVRLQSEMQTAKTALHFFPDISHVREIIGWYQNKDGSVDVRLQKSLADGTEFLLVQGLEPSQVVKADSSGIEAANGLKLSFIKGLDGKYKDIRLVDRTGAHVSLYVNTVPEGKIMLTAVGGNKVPTIASPIDEFFGSGGGMKGLEASQVRSLSPNAELNGSKKSCRSVLDPRSWFK